MNNKFKLSKTTSIKIASCALLIMLISIVLTGCNNYKDCGDYTVEFFDDSRECYIRSFSKSGELQEELVVPTMLNGISVKGIGSGYAPSFRSKKLKKLFWSGNQKLCCNKHIMDTCPEFETVVFTSVDPSAYSNFFSETYVWTFYNDFKQIRIILLDEVKEWILEHEDKYYVPRYIIESPSPNVYFNLNYSATSSVFSDDFKEELIESFYAKTYNNKENEELNKKINKDLIAYCEKYNFEIDDFFKLELQEMVEFMLAFMSENFYEELETIYNMLNHENYLWIDYLEVGDKIKTMPPTPTREGYQFMGWYSDSMCTNKADLKSFVKDSENATFYARWEQK